MDPVSEQQPTLGTARLVLRPFRASDAERVSVLANDSDIARNTLTIPHPYPDGLAASWIAAHLSEWTQGRRAAFAVCLRDSRELCGAAGLELERKHARAELGYWIARPHWNSGLATEGARALIDFAFDDLGLQRVYAAHFTWNPASGRVLEKCGMRREGLLRGHVLKLGQPTDEVMYGILRDDPRASAAAHERSGALARTETSRDAS